MSPKAIVLLLVASASLIACDAIDTMTDGFSHSRAVSAKLESSLGLKNTVGFNWNNGSLDSVTITFAGVPSSPSLPEISVQVRQAVIAEFKQSPKAIVLAFSVAQ